MCSHAGECYLHHGDPCVVMVVNGISPWRSMCSHAGELYCTMCSRAGE